MKNITITGIAENSKAGAVVITDANEVYYLDGISSWTDEYLRKNVDVEGILINEYQEENILMNEKGEYRQGLSGELKKISKPEWKLAIKTSEKDSILNKLRNLLPKTWSMEIEKDKLIITCKEKAYSLFENKINAPHNSETPLQKEEKFKKNGKLINGQFIYILKDKLTENEINQIGHFNKELYKAIAVLKEKLKDIPVSYKDGNYWPRNKEEEKIVADYEKEKKLLENKIVKLPNYQSERYAFYLEAETGLETEFVSIYPEKYSIEMYRIKNEVFENVLLEVR